jgi:CBS-domain-containing membrane protein
VQEETAMIAPNDRLKTLTVADAMSRGLITISCNSTLSEAADVLCEHQITGAPVVDECGRCVGVISGSDFIHSKAEELDCTSLQHVLNTGRPYGAVCIEEVRHDLVRSRMTPYVRTIGENVPLIRAARTMCNDHIHRLIVVDKEARPLGILTSLDMIATFIGVVDE